MGVAFYDNRDPLADPDTADVDRVYCLDWDRFGPAEWATLDRIYPQLPGWVEYRGVPFWFGTDEHDIPHLCASVEPTGLQVSGVLPATDWEAWEGRFGEAIAELPGRELK